MTVMGIIVRTFIKHSYPLLSIRKETKQKNIMPSNYNECHEDSKNSWERE